MRAPRRCGRRRAASSFASPRTAGLRLRRIRAGRASAVTTRYGRGNRKGGTDAMALLPYVDETKASEKTREILGARQASR